MRCLDDKEDMHLCLHHGKAGAFCGTQMIDNTQVLWYNQLNKSMDVCSVIKEGNE